MFEDSIPNPISFIKQTEALIAEFLNAVVASIPDNVGDDHRKENEGEDEWRTPLKAGSRLTVMVPLKRKMRCWYWSYSSRQ